MSNLNVVVRVMPGGEELDVTLPRYSTGSQITDELLKAQVAPSTDPEGNPYVYDLVTKRDNIRIEPDKTLHDLGVSDGETILFIPQLVAGYAPSTAND